MHIAIVFSSYGHYTIIIEWEREHQADLNDIEDALLLVKQFVKEKVWNVRYQKLLTVSHFGVDAKDSARTTCTIPLPASQCLDHGQSNVMISQLETELMLRSRNKLDYRQMQTLCDAFPMYTSQTSTSADVNRFLSKNPHRKQIISRLIKEHLLDVSALATLTRHDWSTLQLLDNSHQNKILLNELQSFIMRFCQQGFSLLYKRHSRFGTLQQQQREIAKFMTSHKIEFRDLFDDTKEFHTLLQNQLLRNFGMSRESAIVMMDNVRNSHTAFRGTSSQEIRCLIQQGDEGLRVNVSGLRKFSDTSSVRFLFDHVHDFLSRFLTIYDSNTDIQAYLTKNKLRTLALEPSTEQLADCSIEPP